MKPENATIRSQQIQQYGARKKQCGYSKCDNTELKKSDDMELRKCHDMEPGKSNTKLTKTKPKTQ